MRSAAGQLQFAAGHRGIIKARTNIAFGGDDAQGVQPIRQQLRRDRDMSSRE